jgi:hypothetical protein
VLKSVLHRRSRIAPILAMGAVLPFTAASVHGTAVHAVKKAPTCATSGNFVDVPCTVTETATGGIAFTFDGSNLAPKQTYAVDAGTLAGGSLGTVACAGKTTLDGLFAVTTDATGSFTLACTAGHTYAWTYVITLIDEKTFATYNTSLTVKGA